MQESHPNQCEDVVCVPNTGALTIDHLCPPEVSCGGVSVRQNQSGAAMNFQWLSNEVL